MNINNDITVLDLDKINDFDITKKGKFLFLLGLNIDDDFIFNLKKIVKNFKYIIFFNQDRNFLNFVFDSIPNFNNIVKKEVRGISFGRIKNVFDIKGDKVLIKNYWGFHFSLYSESNIVIKNNYYMPNNNNVVLSSILGKKFIFPLFPLKFLLDNWFVNKFTYKWNSGQGMSEEKLFELLEFIKPQVTLLLSNEDIPDWALDYSKKAQNIKSEIIQKNDEMKKLDFEIETLENESEKSILENNFLWTDGIALESSIEKIIHKFFPKWIKLDKLDNEDLLFKNGNDIFIFEIKGTVKNINENYITQLLKYIPAIEENLPSECILFPILFINNQKNINPAERKFKYESKLENRVLKNKISVITSTRLYKLLQQENYAQIERDIKTVGLHYE